MTLLRTDVLTRVLLVLLCVLVGASDPSAKSNSTADSTPTLDAGSSTTPEPALKTLEFFVEGFHIDKKYLSMEGPEQKLPVKSALENAGRAVWVKSMTVEILDEQREPLSAEFLCHAWLAFRSPRRGGMMSVSQGTKSVTLPEGFAFVMPNDPETKLTLIGMIENNNHEVIDQKAVMKYTIDYYSDEEARKSKLKKLETLNMVGRPDAPAVHHQSPMKPKLNPHHWMVPPGRHTYRSALTRPMFRTPGNPLGISEGTRIHFMRPHLHGYGESVALNDKTTGKTVWKGYAENAKELRHIVGVDFYSDVDGIPLYPDHEYELVIVYNNPTQKPVDAMGALRAFVSVE
jgi:hypothetical protein